MNLSRLSDSTDNNFGKRSQPVPFPKQIDSDEEAERKLIAE